MTSISYIDQAAYSVATQGSQPETTPVMGSKSLNLSQRLRYRTSDLRRELTGYIRYGYRDQDGDGLRRNKYLSNSLGGQAYQAFGELHNLRLDYNHELYNRDNFLSVSKERTPIFHFTGNTVRLQYTSAPREDSRPRQCRYRALPRASEKRAIHHSRHTAPSYCRHTLRAGRMASGAEALVCHGISPR